MIKLKEMQERVKETDSIISTMDKEIWYSYALFDVVELLKDELTLDQIIKIHQLKLLKK